MVAPAVPGRKGAATLVARVVSITFKNDHRDASGAKLLKGAAPQATVYEDLGAKKHSFQSDVSETGTVTLQKPDWSLTIPRNDPVSYTAGTAPVIDIQIQFKKVPGGSAQLQQVIGLATTLEGRLAALTFDLGRTQTVKDGDLLTLSDQTGAALPTRIAVHEATIKWSVVVNGSPLTPIGSSGPHKILTTLGPPIGTVEQVGDDFNETGARTAITVPRLELAVRGANGASSERQAADKLFETFSKLGINYTLGRRSPDLTGVSPKPSTEHYLWLCAKAKAEGECHVIAAAFRLALRAVGVQQAMTVGFMRAQPGRQERPDTFPRRTDILKGRLNVTATRTTARGTFTLCFLDQFADPNKFEGVVKFGDVLYAIGDSIFDRVTAPQDGLSIDDLNSTDYFTLRQQAIPRSTIVDAKKGAFDLLYLDAKGKRDPLQYPWEKIPDAPPLKGQLGLNGAPFRWEE